MKYLFILIAIIPLGCNYDNVTPLVSLDGTWVEQSNRKDTLIFDQKLNSDNSSYFKYKGIGSSWLYEYKIVGNTISIYNLVSSCYCFSDYHFVLDRDKMFIGNFYDPNSKGVVDIFEKLK